jgi:hypothetical protein
MHETRDDLRHLQDLMDRTLAGINPHMAGIVTQSRRLNAAQVVRALDGIRHVAFATVNAGGEPRVSPLDTLFLRGRFTLSTGGQAARIANLRRNPACSAVHMVADTLAVTVNGTVEWITREHPDHEEIHGAWSTAYESDPYSWGDDIVFFRIEPSSMWAYAFRPGDFPE